MQWTKICVTATNSLLLCVVVNISPCNAQYSANADSNLASSTFSNSVAQQQMNIHSRPSFEDLPSLLKKRIIKVLVVNHPAYYFIYQSRPRGFAYDMMREYEKHLNRKYFKNTKLKLNILFIPVPSSQIINLLAQGYGDIAIGPLMTPLRQQNQVTHTEPIYTNNQLLLISHDSTIEYKDIKI
ncbi:transporter substrate-binding domain-containing protein [Moritella viscosa]|uniref:transporter substrate-binding domain-containing protein n=1 Tax=Moritella viscosa TaxID=80854 RepID=UPI00091383A8|nr:transporter substrate-binding domain-containing protein [Moritella viscosa]SGY86713.1 Amino-acid abc transporter binding protein [Moritella viscosa]